jgi:hypothetical protein
MGWKEVNAWNKLVMPFWVSNAFLFYEFHKIELKNYTWSKKNPTIVCSWLDRFYVNPLIHLQGGRHEIWPTMGHVTNCTLVFLQIHFMKSKKPNHIPFNFFWFRINTKQNVLDSKNFKNQYRKRNGWGFQEIKGF